MRSPTLTHGALALLIVIWGTTWAAIRVGLEGIPPFTGVSLRFGLAALLLLMVGRALQVPLGTGRRIWALWAVNAVLTFSVPYGVVYWAEQWVPSGLAAVLFATFPLFVAAMAHVWLPGERLTGVALLGISTGFAGVAVIFSEDLASLAGADIRRAALLFLVSPLASAVANVIIKRWGAGVHPISLTAVPMALTALLVGGLAAAVERHRSLTLDLVSVGALLYLAVCGTAVTFFLYFWLLSRLPATRLALITYGVPVVAVVVGALFLGESFTLRMLLGGGLVLLGVAIALGRSRRR